MTHAAEEGNAKHEVGDRMVVGVYHTPSDVQRSLATHRFKTLAAIAWKINTATMRHRANVLKRKFKAAGAMLSNDWNADFHMAWFRALIKIIYPAWTLNWSVDMPKGDTHDNRLIDGTLVKGLLKVVSARLYKDDASSDHRPYFERLKLVRHLFKHIHSSSRFNRSPESLLAACREYAQDCDLITLTETEREDRKAVLHEVKGFGVVTGHVNNRDDCSILYREAMWKVVHQEQYKLSNRPLWLMGHRTPPSYACFAVLERVA